MNENRAKELQQEALEVMIRKNHDYGSANLSETGQHGVAVRLLDKVHRLLRLTKGDVIPYYEEPQKDFLDVANYGIIGMMIGEGSWEGSYADGDEVRSNMVYLAGPIDGIPLNDSTGWRKFIAHELKKVGLSAFNPLTAFMNADRISAPQVRAINRAAIANSLAVIALLSIDSRSPAFGTIREIEFAVSIGIPVVVISRGLASLDQFDVVVVESFSDAVRRVHNLYVAEGMVNGD